MNPDSYQNLKEEIITFANQPSVRNQLREQIDRLCEMVEKRIEIIRPIKEEAHKRHLDPKIRKQARQKQINNIKERIGNCKKPRKEILEAINKSFIIENSSHGLLRLPELELQGVFWFCVNEWPEVQKHYGTKKKIQHRKW